MPVLYVMPDRMAIHREHEFPTSSRVAVGSCDSCGRTDALFSQDRDGCGPWACRSCFEDLHGDEPDFTSASDCGFNEEFGAVPLFSDRAEGDLALALEGHTEHTPPAREPDTSTSIGRLRADRVVESYDFDNDYQPRPPRLMLPALSDREPRMVSVEQEIGKGREYIADAFHREGHALSARTHGYHAGDDGGFCRVEDDASVNAEIIYSKLHLSDAAVAQRFEDALGLVRTGINEGEIKLDMRCGLHVHVDARGLGMEQITNLYNLWNHVEDTVFRLASANWRCHRTAVASSNYAPPTMKGLESRAAIGRHFENGRGALNLANFMASRTRCRCGAFAYAAWEDCTCDLAKSTVEFRVFNATANLRKVHAYTALSLAMVEASKRLRVNADDFPAFHFESSRIEVEGDVMKEATKKALAVIFEGMLPLTEGEREDLAYCARNSSVKDVYAEVYGA